MSKPMIEIHGIKEALKDLQKAQSSIEDSVVDNFKDHGKEMVKILKSVSPKKSGKLKRSIKSFVFLDYGKPIKLLVMITRRGFYGYFMEFGTSKQAAQPFFFSAMYKYFPEIEKSIRAMIDERIKRSNALTKLRRKEIISKMGFK